jgi:DNA transposition AAA+ family ATPase
LLVKVATIEELFKTSFIPTDRHSEYARWIDKIRVLKRCGRAIGPDHVGISRSSEHYRNEDRKRISYVSVLSKISSNKLFSLILKDINHAAWRGNTSDLYGRLVECLELFGINLLLIDNAEFLQKDTLLDIKQLHKNTGVPIILIGKRQLDLTLKKHNLFTYFPSLFEFHPLTESDFLKTLEAIELDILALSQASNLWKGELLGILVRNTQCRIGLLIDILTEAVMDSLMKGYGRIDETIVHNIDNRTGKSYDPSEAEKKIPS